MKQDDLFDYAVMEITLYYGEKAKKIIDSGYYGVAVAFMDDEIREELHDRLAPCSDLKFLTNYMILHEEKFGEEFEI